jgi:hypothetical protein
LAKTIGKAARVPWPDIPPLPEASRADAGKLSSPLGEKEQPGFIDLETRFLLEKLIDHLDSERPSTESKKRRLLSLPGRRRTPALALSGSRKSVQRRVLTLRT